MAQRPAPISGVVACFDVGCTHSLFGGGMVNAGAGRSIRAV